MRVLCFINSLSSGGAERQLVGLASMLAIRGFEVEVCTYKSDNFYSAILDKAGVAYTCLNTSNVTKRIIGTIKRIRAYKPDAVISYLEQPSTFCCIAKLFAKFRLIVSERNTTQSLTSNAKTRFRLYRLADWIVPNSYTQADYITNLHHDYQSKTITITNYTDVEYFVTPIIREDHPVTRVVVAARINKQKNIPLFIEALSILKERGTRILVDWYGNPVNNEYADLCNGLVKKKGVEDILRFHSATNNILNEYQTADCFILPSLYEGYPNVVCEAMCCGLPILCSNVCDNPHIVKDGVNGYLFNPADPTDMADKIEKFIILPKDKKDSMCFESRKISEHLFSKETFINKYIKLLN